jgi:hypothetical protein
MKSQLVASVLGIWEKPVVTEKELDALCRTYGVTLRINKRGYEGYKKVKGKTRAKYLIGVGRLGVVPEWEIRQKLDEFLNFCKSL